MKIAVFAYNFPHRKTQDFLQRLFLEKVDIGVVLAADPVELSIPKSVIRTKPNYGALVHPRLIAERYGWRYEVIEHNSDHCASLLRTLGIDLAIIAGARILKQPIIEAVRTGIVNFHPGILPEMRGLDALQWAIYKNAPIGNTAHLIDKRVDGGVILIKRPVAVKPDDTLLDVSIKLHDQQVEMIPEVLEIVQSTSFDSLEEVGKGSFHRKMEPELEMNIPALFEKYKQQCIEGAVLSV